MAEGLQGGDKVDNMAFANHLPHKILKLFQPLTLGSSQACCSPTLNFTTAFCLGLFSQRTSGVFQHARGPGLQHAKHTCSSSGTALAVKVITRLVSK